MAGPVIVYDARPVMDLVGYIWRRFLGPVFMIFVSYFALLFSAKVYLWMFFSAPLGLLFGGHLTLPPAVIGNEWVAVIIAGVLWATWLVPAGIAIAKSHRMRESRGFLNGVLGLLKSLFIFSGWGQWSLDRDHGEISPFEWIFKGRIPIFYTIFYQVGQWAVWLFLVGLAVVAVNVVIWGPALWLLETFDLWPALSSFVDFVVEAMTGKHLSTPLGRDELIWLVILLPLAPKIFLIAHKMFSIQLGWQLDQFEDETWGRVVSWPIMG